MLGSDTKRNAASRDFCWDKRRTRASRSTSKELRTICTMSVNSSDVLNFPLERERERDFFVDNLLVRIHLTIQMILADQPCAMGV